MIKHVMKAFANGPGWRTDRKIVVLESDDWGSIRMPSNEAFRILTDGGVSLGQGYGMRYNRFDTLESADDLNCLFDVLGSFKDQLDNHPVLTAISVVANPDFGKIRESGYSNYHYEPFTRTLERYGRTNAWEASKQGLREKIFVPQFHGREHLNIPVWMRALQAGDKDTLLAFQCGCWGFKSRHPISYQAAFDLETIDDLEFYGEVIRDGLKLFKRIHGYHASYFVPPNGPFNNRLEPVAFDSKIRFMSASKIQREPLGGGKTKIKLHWLGQKNRSGQIYVTRNAFFEPSLDNKDWVDSCLNDIRIAFKWRKPAVISSHRVNYIGELDVKNRDRGLAELRQLLNRILKFWPDVEFMSSDELGSIISSDKFGSL